MRLKYPASWLAQPANFYTPSANKQRLPPLVEKGWGGYQAHCPDLNENRTTGSLPRTGVPDQIVHHSGSENIHIIHHWVYHLVPCD